MWRAGSGWRWLMAKAFGRHGPVKSFQERIQEGGGLQSGTTLGLKVVETERIIGSVGRARELRSDFFYRRGRAVTNRFRRIEAVMRAGKPLPPVDLYRVRTDGRATCARNSEYYVLDGHHRVAMARKLGQVYLDAHVVEFRLTGADQASAQTAPGEEL